MSTPGNAGLNKNMNKNKDQYDVASTMKTSTQLARSSGPVVIVVSAIAIPTPSIAIVVVPCGIPCGISCNASPFLWCKNEDPQSP